MRPSRVLATFAAMLFSAAAAHAQAGTCAQVPAVAMGSYQAAPFAVTIQQSGNIALQSATRWVKTGGNFDWKVEFSEPVPIEWLALDIIDLNADNSSPYNATISLAMTGGAGFAEWTPGQFPHNTSHDQLTYNATSGQVTMTTRTGGANHRESIRLTGNSDATVTSIRVSSTGIAAGDHVAFSLWLRPPCLTIEKVSDPQAGTFDFDLDNVFDPANGLIASAQVTTTSAGVSAASPTYHVPEPADDVILSEVVSGNWSNTQVACTDRNSTVTGNPAAFGTFAAGAMTIASANLRPEADIVCRFTNRAAELTLVKSVVNAHDGTATAADFTLTAVGPTPLSGISGSAAVTNALVAPGAYVLGEGALPGYVADDYSCAVNGQAAVSGNSLTLDPGDVAVCSVVNRDTAADVVVGKQLVAESGAVDGVAEPNEDLTYRITLSNAGGPAPGFSFIENVPSGATLVSVAGATGFAGPVAGPAAVALQVAPIPAGAAAQVTVVFRVADPIPVGIAEIANTISGGDIDPACTTCTVVLPVVNPALRLDKSGRYEDADGSGSPTPGDTLTYSFVITNTGNVPLVDVGPVDAGPTFAGNGASNRLSAVTPPPLTLGPGASRTFTATYVLSQADIDHAAGVADGVANKAKAHGYSGGAAVPSNLVESADSLALLVLPARVEPDIALAKQAGLRTVRRGETVPYSIVVTNNATARASGLAVTDVAPSGFRYVEGSATVDGVAATPVIDGRRIVFDNLTAQAGGELVIRLRLTALSSAGPGKHVNTATVTGADGNRLAPDASATVEILADPAFDCGDVIGKVFDDKNGNGYQDEGEPGLPGVRLATVNGVLVTTDAHGRFHVACADLPDQRIGSNFIMKLDIRTLPSGYGMTTENPRVVRLTAGKMTRLSFGASIGPVVRLDLRDEAFAAGRVELRPEWSRGLDDLVALLGKEKSNLRVAYVHAATATGLARQRMQALEREITDRWRKAGHRTRLDIETRLEAAR